MKKKTFLGRVLGSYCLAAITILFTFNACKAYQPEAEIKVLFKRLIDEENRHDLKTVRTFLWESDKSLFISKTKSFEDGGWGGYWGTNAELQHFHDLYQGTFRIDPNYGKQKIVFLTPDVAQIYVPAKFTVSYDGQIPTPKPFIMVTIWIKTSKGWKMSTDIPLPVPQEQPNK